MSEKQFTEKEVKAALELVVAITTSEISEEKKAEYMAQLSEDLQELVGCVLLQALINLMERRRKLKCEATKAFTQALKDKIAKEEDEDEDEEESPKMECSCKANMKVRSFSGFEEFMKFLTSQR